MRVDIIPSTEEHIDDIIEIEKLVFSVPWSKNALIQEITENRFAVYFSAKILERIVGYVGMWKIFDEGHITNLAVHPDYQKGGIGRILLEYLIGYSTSKDITKMTLEVRKSNEAAKSLYYSFGFKNAGIRKNYYSGNEDAIIMWKNLT